MNICLNVQPDETLISYRETYQYRWKPEVTGPSSGNAAVDIVKSSTLTKHPANQQDVGSMLLIRKGPALTGSDQARKGRLVDALAARGDEGRDTLR